MVGPRNIEEFLCISFQFQRIIIFLILYNKFQNSISIRNFNISFIGKLIGDCFLLVEINMGKLRVSFSFIPF